MKESVVIDASVVVRWVVNDEYSASARTWMDEGSPKLVPTLIDYEIANTFWRILRADASRSDELQQGLSALLQWPFVRIQAREIAVSALQLGLQTGRSAYDAVYLALAIEHECTLVTLDRRLLESARSIGIDARAP